MSASILSPVTAAGRSTISSGSRAPRVRGWREERRLRVLALYRMGWLQKMIAEALGITKGYVSQLVKRFKDLPESEQAASLAIENHAGAKVRITQEQREKICALVERPATEFGFPGSAWTLARLCQAVGHELDLSISKSWLSEMLHAHGYSCQVPETRAAERNDKAAGGFKGGGWAALKKGR